MTQVEAAAYIHTLCAVAGKNVNYCAWRVKCFLSENLKDARLRSEEKKANVLPAKAH